MSFDLNDDQLAFQETARRFAREKLAPGYQRREVEGRIDRALVREMGALGLIAPELPEEMGGLGTPSLTSGLIAEAIGYADVNAAYIQILGSLNGKIIAGHARPELARQWLPRLVSGEVIVAIGLTEPRGGSDAANLALSARRKATPISSTVRSHRSAWPIRPMPLLLFARTGRSRQRRARRQRLPRSDHETGVRTRLQRSRQQGGRAWVDLLRRCPGAVRHGWPPRVTASCRSCRASTSRALIGLQCVAAAQASLDETWQYVKEREAFGAALAQYQGVSFPLAEAETFLTMARQLCHLTLDLRDRGLPHTAEAAMAKWYAPKTSVDVIHQCLLTHGHYGYSMDLPHQQRLRDVMGLEIGDGTAQIMKLIIAREKLKAAAA